MLLPLFLEDKASLMIKRLSERLFLLHHEADMSKVGEWQGMLGVRAAFNAFHGGYQVLVTFS